MKKRKIRTLSLLSVSIALSIVLSRLLGFYLTPSLRVSFEYFPIILSGILFGPLGGAAVGGISDFLGATLFSGLGFFPPMILGPIFTGLLSGLLAQALPKQSLQRWWVLICLSMTVDLLCNFFWGTYALSLMLGTPFWANLALRAPVKLGIALIDAYLVFAVYRALGPIFTKRQT